VIHFLWAAGVPSGEIHRRISAQYGNSVVLQQTVCELIDSFKNGRTSVKHKEGARRPFTSITDTKTESVGDMVLQNRRASFNEVGQELQISHGLAYEITHNRLVFHEVSARRFPEQFK
jgi:hypothetical protein